MFIPFYFLSLFTYFISSSTINDVNLTLFCDDFCTNVSVGNQQIYSRPFTNNNKKNQCQIEKITYTIDVSKLFQVEVTNNDADFGFAGKIDYHFFKITTDQRDYWTILL